jgi:ornithine lipid ester-linked acyl 2-hydroxylase
MILNIKIKSYIKFSIKNMYELIQDHSLFSDGYTYRKHNNSFNRNDKLGYMLWILFISGFIFLLLYIINNKKENIYNSTINKWLIIASIIFFIISIYIAWKDPIKLMYMCNVPLTSITRTPAYFHRQQMIEIFPECSNFEKSENFNKLKNEVNSLLNSDIKLPSVDQVYGDHNQGIQAENNGWKVLIIKAGDVIVNRQICPFLTSLVENNSDIMSCMVSILKPRKRIPIHVGYSKSFIRYQLGVIVPKDRQNCFIWINGDKYSWCEGESVMFDDCFPHLVYNNTDEIRVVIYMDILRPYKNRYVNSINKWLANMFVNSKYVQEETKKTEIQVSI